MSTIESMVVANAAGMVKRPEHVEALVHAAVTRVVVGSLTLEPRTGNIGETYYYNPVTRVAWNAKGLDNQGIREATTWLPRMRDLLNRNGKELAVSIAAFSPEEYAECVELVAPWVDRIELNLGCPNAWKDGVKKPIVSYDPAATKEVLKAVEGASRFNRKYSVKVSPIEDELVRPLARAISAFEYVDEVVACNTLPNEEGVRDNDAPALSFRTEAGGELRHTGGASGAKLRPHRIRLVKAFRRELPKRVTIIGAGGIDSGIDVRSCINRGAGGFMVGTHFFEHGPGVFSEMLLEAV